MAETASVQHREDEYNSHGFELLLKMQRDHFWYRGRHRFLTYAVRRCLRGFGTSSTDCRAVDLGGGCGGWLHYLEQHARLPFAERALADSSRPALDLAVRPPRRRSRAPRAGSGGRSVAQLLRPGTPPDGRTWRAGRRSGCP